MQPGETVQLRAYGGKEIARRLVAIEGDTLLVCLEEEFRRAKHEGREPTCVGFKTKDVLGHVTS